MDFARIRQLQHSHWAMFFAAILAAWCALFLMSFAVSSRSLDWYALRELCTIRLDGLGYLQILGMWSVMSLAMMLPTLLPILTTYHDLGHHIKVQPWHLILGFLAVWVVFSAIAALIQMGLYAIGAIDALGQTTHALVSVGLLVIAGLYQFSPQKAACLAKCRQPLTFFFQHIDEGPFRNGVRLGIVCVGCCWALMMLGFVGGVMNLAFMGLATILMILEKWPQIGAVVTRPLGAALLFCAVFMAVSA